MRRSHLKSLPKSIGMIGAYIAATPVIIILVKGAMTGMANILRLLPTEYVNKFDDFLLWAEALFHKSS